VSSLADAKYEDIVIAKRIDGFCVTVLL